MQLRASQQDKNELADIFEEFLIKKSNMVMKNENPIN